MGLSTAGGNVAFHVLHQPLELVGTSVGQFGLVYCAWHRIALHGFNMNSALDFSKRGCVNQI